MRRSACGKTRLDGPLQKSNLIDAPDAQSMLASLKTDLLHIQETTGGLPDKMP